MGQIHTQIAAVEVEYVAHRLTEAAYDLSQKPSQSLAQN